MNRNLINYSCLYKFIAAYYFTTTQLLLFVRTAQYCNSASQLCISSVFPRQNTACYSVSNISEKNTLKSFLNTIEKATLAFSYFNLK